MSLMGSRDSDKELSLEEGLELLERAGLVEGEGDPEVLRDLFAGDGSALPTMPRFREEKVGAASA